MTNDLSSYSHSSFVTRHLRKTHLGPIVALRDGKQLALRMARVQEGGQLEQWHLLGKARNLKEFRAAMSRVAIPMFTLEEIKANLESTYHPSEERTAHARK